jgi:hypothetical protein
MFLLCGGTKENRLGIAHSQLVWRRSIIIKGTVWEIKNPPPEAGGIRKCRHSVICFLSSYIFRGKDPSKCNEHPRVIKNFAIYMPQEEKNLHLLLQYIILYYENLYRCVYSL